MSRASNNINKAITEAVTSAVTSPETNAHLSDIDPIVEAVTQEVTPMVINSTNQEPWYQSAIIMGALTTIALKALAQLGWAIPQEYHGQVLDTVIAVGPYIASGWVILARKGWFKKPIGYGPILGWIFNRK